MRSRLAWASALWIGTLIHLDWHLGRPGHTHLSLGLPCHWLLGVVAFAPLPWLLVRRWPNALAQASAVAIGLGVILGQALEPLGEVILDGAHPSPFTNPVRWRVFAEFMAAGLLTAIISVALARRRLRRPAA